MEKPLAYSGAEPFIFISYSHRDSENVWEFLKALQKDGYRFWYDDGIEPGVSWDDYIAEHIDSCGYFIAFISEAYSQSENCIQELRFAIESKKNILLVRLDQTRLSPGLEMRVCSYQAINSYTLSEEEIVEKIEEADGIKAFRPEQQLKAKRYSYKEKYPLLMKTMKQGYYCEAILLEREIIDHTLFWCLYNMGFTANVDSTQIRNRIRDELKTMLEPYADDEQVSLGIGTLEGKLKIVELMYIWANSSEPDDYEGPYRTLVSQMKNGKCLEYNQLFKAVENWNTEIRKAMNDIFRSKSAVVSEENNRLALRGQEIARKLNSVYIEIKKGNRIRKSWGLK